MSRAPRRAGAALAGLVLVLGPLGTSGAEETDASRAPIPLHRPAPETPPETLGSGVSPIVELEIVVDERGVVSDVEALAIEPHSEHDALFIETARAALRAWRFAPALDSEGTPTSVTLSWKVRLPERVAATRRPQRGPYLDFGRSRDELADEVRTILALPWEQRRKMLVEIATTAKGLMDASRISSAENEYFGVYIDYGDAEIAATIAQNLAAAWTATYQLFGERIPALPSRGRVLVFVYGRESSYKRLAATIGGHEWSAGFYHASGLLAFHAERGSSEGVLGTLIHEATHALMDRHVFGSAAHVPRWLNEGFAEYMGNSDIKRGRLIPGGHKQRTTRWAFTPRRTAVVKSETASWVSTKTVKKAVKKGTALTVRELFTASPDQFYGEKASLFYPQSWLLVHFLRHGDDDWAEDAFPRFILLVAEGYDTRDAFEDAYGAVPESFENAYRDYVREF